MKIAESLDLDADSVKSIRAGGIIGVHEILFGFPFQTVRLKHESISREAFGNGAKFAVEELAKRDKGFYTMEQLLGPYFVDSNKEYLPEPKDELPSLVSRIRLQLSKRLNSFLNRRMSSK